MSLKQLIALMGALGLFGKPVHQGGGGPKVDPPKNQISRPVLTARDQGMYVGVPWKASEKDTLPAGFYERTKDFRFAFGKITNNISISPEQLDKSINAVNGLLDAAEKLEPKRAMIVQIYFWDGDERYRGSGADPNRAKYEQRLNDVLKRLKVNSSSLVAITLAEENVPNSGRGVILNDLYRFVKSKYPELPVYQWFSGNLLAPARHDGVFTGTDGWIINPYTLCKENAPDSRLGWGDDPYLRLVQKYVITRKPVVSVLWAADDRPFYFDKNDPKNKDRIDMREIMDHQLDLNFAFNLPSGFYNLRTKNGRLTPYYSLDEAGENPLLAQITDYLGKATSRAAVLPTDYAGKLDRADRWSGKTLEDDELDERFADSNFIQNSSGSGFRDLYWNGSELGFVGYQGRDVNASVNFTFQNNRNRRVTVEVVNNGSTVELINGPARQTFKQNGTRGFTIDGTGATVTIKVTGPAGTLERPTVSIRRISITR